MPPRPSSPPPLHGGGCAKLPVSRPWPRPGSGSPGSSSWWETRGAVGSSSREGTTWTRNGRSGPLASWIWSAARSRTSIRPRAPLSRGRPGSAFSRTGSAWCRGSSGPRPSRSWPKRRTGASGTPGSAGAPTTSISRRRRPNCRPGTRPRGRNGPSWARFPTIGSAMMLRSGASTFGSRSRTSSARSSVSPGSIVLRTLSAHAR